MSQPIPAAMDGYTWLVVVVCAVLVFGPYLVQMLRERNRKP